MHSPEMLGNNNEADDLQEKKDRLKEIFVNDGRKELQDLANNEEFWSEIAPENVDLLLEKWEAVVESRGKIEKIEEAKKEEDARIANLSNAEKLSGEDGAPSHEGMEFDSRLIEKGRNIIKNSPQTYINVDIEADGVAGYGSMLSIGAVSPDGEKFYSEICPSSDNFVEKNRQFTETHGLERERLLKEAPKSDVVMKEFADWVRKTSESNDNKKPVFVAFNAAFDWSFVDLYFKQNNIENPFGVAPLDLKSQAISLAPDFDWEKTKKQNLPSSIKPNEEFTHNALDDASYQQTLMYGITALSQEPK